MVSEWLHIPERLRSRSRNQLRMRCDPKSFLFLQKSVFYEQNKQIEWGYLPVPDSYFHHDIENKVMSMLFTVLPSVATPLLLWKVNGPEAWQFPLRIRPRWRAELNADSPSYITQKRFHSSTRTPHRPKVAQQIISFRFNYSLALEPESCTCIFIMHLSFVSVWTRFRYNLSHPKACICLFWTAFRFTSKRPASLCCVLSPIGLY